MYDGGDYINPSGPLYLCGRSDGESRYHFGGSIAEFSVYNEPLDHYAVLGLYFSKANNGQPQGCVYKNIEDDCQDSCSQTTFTTMDLSIDASAISGIITAPFILSSKTVNFLVD